METILINGIEFNIKALKGLNQDDFNKMFSGKLGVKTLSTWQQLEPHIKTEKLSLDQIFREFSQEVNEIKPEPEFKPKKKKKKFL